MGLKGGNDDHNHRLRFPQSTEQTIRKIRLGSHFTPHPILKA